MTRHGRIRPFSQWRALSGVRQWLAWIIGSMVVGFGLAGGLLVAHHPNSLDWEDVRRLPRDVRRVLREH